MTRRNETAAMEALCQQLLFEITATISPRAARESATRIGVSPASVLVQHCVWMHGQLIRLTAGEISTDRLASMVGLIREYREQHARTVTEAEVERIDTAIEALGNGGGGQ